MEIISELFVGSTILVGIFVHEIIELQIFVLYHLILLTNMCIRGQKPRYFIFIVWGILALSVIWILDK